MSHAPTALRRKLRIFRKREAPTTPAHGFLEATLHLVRLRGCRYIQPPVITNDWRAISVIQQMLSSNNQSRSTRPNGGRQAVNNFVKAPTAIYSDLIRQRW